MRFHRAIGRRPRGYVCPRWVTALVFAITWGGPAAAADADPATAIALKQFDVGRRAFENRSFEEALRAFQESNSLAASPNSRLYIARCYRALGKVASAYTAYRLAAREAQDRLTATKEKRYGATREAANNEAAEIEAQVPRLTIAVPAGVPDGFSVKENGTDIPKAVWGAAIETDPGDVTIEAAGPRLVPFKKTIALSPGARERVEVTATRTPTAVLVVALKTKPSGLTITLDGVPLEVKELEGERDVDVGTHTLEIAAPGYELYEWRKALDDGEKVALGIALHVDKSAARGFAGTPRWSFFTAAAGAVVALGAATGLALEAQSKRDAEQALDPLLRSTSARDQIGALSTAADVLFIGGGVLAAGAGVLAFSTRWRDGKRTEERASVVPWVSATGAGVAIGGRF